DVDLLMGTAVVAAVAVGYPVEAATLAVLYSFAELLERYSVDRTRSSLKHLVELRPERARLVTDEGEREVDAEQVREGDEVSVHPGERLPVDGVVSAGTSALDTSMVTGESMPVDVGPGDDVYAGSVNQEGAIEVRATKSAGESTIARVVELVREAESRQTERERYVDRLASIYTPAVLAAAVTAVLVPPLAFDADPGVWFVRGLTLVVIACPCAFVISTPVSVASGLTAAARNAVLVKGGDHLERLGDVDVVALDKTGTLTYGEPAVDDVVGGDDALALAAAVETRSQHPLARALTEEARSRGLAFSAAEDVVSRSGRGVEATVDGEAVYVGSPEWMDELDVDLSVALEGRSLEDALDEFSERGVSSVVVARDGVAVGAVGFADEVRVEAAETVERLRALGVRDVVLLTGDDEAVARSVADDVGITSYEAELLPEEKVDAIERLKHDGVVAMVGDGVNDAPALAAADVGIAMAAAGSDAAIETADVALMGDDVGRLPYLLELSRRSNSVIRENVWSSLAVKLALAVGVPFGLVSVALAVVLGDMGMSLAVTLNAMRLARVAP
ncbi:MAG: heavy metal translocating P-type ATPase, partial [Halobacteriales archaeon]